MRQRQLILAAENRLFREGLKQILASDAIGMIGEVSSLSEALIMLRSTGGADLVLYDHGQGPPDFETVNELRREFPLTGIVMLVDQLAAADLSLALENGVKGFLPQHISAEALSLSLQLIAMDENISARPFGLVESRHERARGELACKIPLSAREGAILECLEEGDPNKVIARKLDMAEATVKVHVKSVLRKINVANRTQAAVWAVNHR